MTTSKDLHEAHKALYNLHRHDQDAAGAISSAAGLALKFAAAAGDISTDDVLFLYRRRLTAICDPAHKALFRESFKLASDEICATLREHLDAKGVV